MIGLAVFGLFAGCAAPLATAGAGFPSSPEPLLKQSVAVQPADTTRQRSKAVKTVPAIKGMASVYADALNGRRTSSGQRFSQQKLTAAHRSLPLGTRVLVTNLRNNRSVEVSINDRGPHHRGRVIDLSSAAAAKLGMNKKGCAQVQLQILGGRSNG
jgi:rare lipoprotein A